MPRVTVLIPTFDHGDTIAYPLACLREQTVQDYEVLIVGDGVPAAAESRLREIVAADARLTFHPFPKHVSRGEPNRHQVLQQARGQVVCYLTDRDLWLPDHLERMLALLDGADFAHSLGLHILPGDQWKFFPVDLALALDRQRMERRLNRVPFSCAAHRLEAYRRLPRGWETTPPGKPTDWHMFQQFLEQPSLRTVSGTYPSALTFPSPPRKGWSGTERLAELERWRERVKTAEGRQACVQSILEAALRDRDRERHELMIQLAEVQASPSWRVGNGLLRAMGAGWWRRFRR
jgi:GalNAc5-diNAcBac-PP-undecaprenol beta-1,3-glucosyltransferase